LVCCTYYQKAFKKYTAADVACFVVVQVSKLTWVERKVASKLFADPPNASIDDALHHFLEAG
jgi:hypothetical protein